MAASEKVIQLRQLLAGKFPAAHAARPRTRDAFHTCLPRLDDIGLPKGELTELVSEHASTGVATLLATLVESALRAPHHVALIDGRDSFDPQSVSADACRNLLWARCRNALEAGKAADLILRDGNLPFILLDLRANPVREVRRLGSPVWYRLQTLARHSSVTCLVLTPAKIVSSARLRITVARSRSLAEVDLRRDRLVQDLELPVTRRRETAGDLVANEQHDRQVAG
ncbi:MAG TPA: hypothetical protein DCY13_05260 [Verrucomicrobiales bacterium]|nr:hypothetical protein [Verrucomicrobiales bacterium]